MRDQQLSRLNQLLAQANGLSPALLSAARVGVGYIFNQPCPVAEVLEIYRHRARWNERPSNVKAGQLTGINEVVQRLEMQSGNIVLHSIQSQDGSWVIFTDSDMKELLGVIEIKM